MYTNLKSDTASVHSTLGGCNNGLLDLVIPINTYPILARIPFTIPHNPGTIPSIPSGISTP